MSKSLLGLVILMNILWGIDVPIDEVEKKIFNEKIKVNSQIIQLNSAKEHIMARMGGKLVRYLVKQGNKIRKGQAIAVVESLELASLASELKSFRRQLSISNKNYKMVKKLYHSGLESQQNLNRQEEERAIILSKIENIKSQLSLLGVSSRGKIKSRYTVYAQSKGRVSKILIPSHSVVDGNTPLVSIVKGGSSLLVKSYIPLRYSSDINIGQKGTMFYGGKSYKMHISQILPELDRQTQQMVVLSTLEEDVKNLFVYAYVDSDLSIGSPKSYLSIKKSALSFFNNEWVVFVPEHHEEDEHEKHHETRRGRASVPTQAHNEEEHEKHNEHKHHGDDDHEEEEVPYDIKVVKILKQNEKWVAIEGLDEHEDYVSDKSYYIKSLLLKSSLGGHGH